MTICSIVCGLACAWNYLERGVTTRSPPPTHSNTDMVQQQLSSALTALTDKPLIFIAHNDEFLYFYLCFQPFSVLFHCQPSLTVHSHLFPVFILSVHKVCQVFSSHPSGIKHSYYHVTPQCLLEFFFCLTFCSLKFLFTWANPWHYLYTILCLSLSHPFIFSWRLIEMCPCSFVYKSTRCPSGALQNATALFTFSRHKGLNTVSDLAVNQAPLIRN